MEKLLSRLGPGMMLAAAAVGVSHLVFSTQAGATYGFSLVWLIVLIVLLKYPAFRFAVLYAGATGRSLVTAYSRISRIALAWLAVGFFVDMFIATAAVALVTAGLMISVFDLPFTGPQVAVGLMVVSALVLLNGQYARAEGIVKTLVILFSILTLIATVVSLPLLGSNDRPLFADMTLDRPLALFVIAMAGWMPIPTNGAILISKWVCEKRASSHGRFSVRDALADFHVSYALMLVIALCFVIMGTAVLFATGRAVPGTPAAFATELFGIFTTIFGQWMYPLIAAAGLAVMWSTQVALMDALPRVTDRLFGVYSKRPPDAPSRYTAFLALQVVGVSFIVLFFLQSFTAFLYFATSMGFIAAPAIAYYNYVAVTSPDMPAELRPTALHVTWNWIGIAAMLAFAIAFLYTTILQ